MTVDVFWIVFYYVIFIFIFMFTITALAYLIRNVFEPYLYPWLSKKLLYKGRFRYW